MIVAFRLLIFLWIHLFSAQELPQCTLSDLIPGLTPCVASYRTLYFTYPSTCKYSLHLTFKLNNNFLIVFQIMYNILISFCYLN